MSTLRTITRRTTGIATASCCALALTAAPAVARPSDPATARQATAAYHDASVITGDSSWFQLSDLQGISCIDSPAGGMGVHFVNGARVGDAVLDAAAPEAVIYEPTADGLRLVALEYVVFKQAWEDAGNAGVPRLFDRAFELVRAGNRYGLPDFYELHAWIWKHNPSGLNADWNPRVTCP